VIIHKHKCIFIHIPKTAGMSIQQGFGREHNHNHPHKKPEDFSLSRWNSYFTFCFVRNPWDRLLSAYLYNINMGTTGRNVPFRKKLLKYRSDFNGFVQAIFSGSSLSVGLRIWQMTM
jgi:hypothetical protein